MTLVELLLAFLRAVVAIGFLMLIAPLAVWADRRQSAMVQDRVGPNRAVVYLPDIVVRGLVVAPPTILGMLLLFWAWKAPSTSAAVDSRVIEGVRKAAFGTMTLAIQLGVFVVWSAGAWLSASARANGARNALEKSLSGVSPRAIFIGGLVAHALGFAAPFLIEGDAVFTAARVVGVATALALFAVGVYTAGRIANGTFALRLAGTIHSLADAIKLIWKEDFVPKNADRLLHSLAPIMAMFTALVTFAIIPYGPRLCLVDANRNGWDWADLTTVADRMGETFSCNAGHTVPLQVVDLNVGILYLFGVAGTGIIGAAIAGWASDNKFSLLGGMRAASQMVSYEVAMGLSLVGIFLIYGTVRLGPMVEWQQANAWGIFVQPFAFFLFLTAVAAECKRVPFDQPEGESEIVAGYFVEYSGMKFGMFMTGEYAELLTSSALLTTLFFGGYALPFVHPDGIRIAFGDTVVFQQVLSHGAVVLISALAFFAKTIFVTFVQVFFRWTLPRFRYDQLMKLGWTKLLPLAIANLFLTAVLVLAVDSAGPGVKSALKIAADLTQMAVAVGGLVGVIALVLTFIEPVDRKGFIGSTAARFAAARGGTKTATQQA